LVTISLCLGSGCASSKRKAQAAANEMLRSADALFSMERAIWDAYRHKNRELLTQMLAEDFRGVVPSGITTKANDLANLDSFQIASFKMEESSANLITPDVGVVRYRVHTNKNSPPIWATSVWVLRQGQWRLTSYQETEVPQ
jgi:hypothetical protein